MSFMYDDEAGHADIRPNLAPTQKKESESDFATFFDSLTRVRVQCPRMK